jgi:hypothetical protein
MPKINIGKIYEKYRYENTIRVPIGTFQPDTWKGVDKKRIKYQSFHLDHINKIIIDYGYSDCLASTFYKFKETNMTLSDYSHYKIKHWTEDL